MDRTEEVFQKTYGFLVSISGIHTKNESKILVKEDPILRLRRAMRSQKIASASSRPLQHSPISLGAGRKLRVLFATNRSRSFFSKFCNSSVTPKSGVFYHDTHKDSINSLGKSWQ
jgi:hypothetical protein